MLKIKTSIFNTSCLSKWESTIIKKFTLVKKNCRYLNVFVYANICECIDHILNTLCNVGCYRPWCDLVTYDYVSKINVLYVWNDIGLDPCVGCVLVLCYGLYVLPLSRQLQRRDCPYPASSKGGTAHVGMSRQEKWRYALRMFFSLLLSLSR